MNSLPIITARLLIRRLHAVDAIALSRYRSIPEVARFQSWPDCSLQQAQDLIAEMDESSPAVKGKWFQFGIELKETGVLIGDIGFLNTDESGNSWIGFTLDPQYWRRGFAAEAVGAVLEFYSTFGITTIWASTDPANTASQRMLEKLGFVLYESYAQDFIYRKAGWP